jgi:hypothetical protein
MNRTRSLLFAVLITALSCGRETAPSGADHAASTAGAAAAIEGFDPRSLEQSLERLNEAAYAPDTKLEDIARLLTDPDDERRWAATYVAVHVVKGDEAAALRPLLGDRVPVVRIMAAGSLAANGFSEGIPVLVEGLGSDAELPYHDPPRPAADLALRALTAYTGQKFTQPEEWRRWWEAHSSSLKWNGKQYVAQ